MWWVREGTGEGGGGARGAVRDSVLWPRKIILWVCLGKFTEFDFDMEMTRSHGPETLPEPTPPSLGWGSDHVSRPGYGRSAAEVSAT